MSRIQSGDGRAFRVLVRRHLQAIHAYAFRLSRSRPDADDLTQETFLRVWQKAATFRSGEVRVTTWLHRITHNSFVDTWRRDSRDEPLDDSIAETLTTPFEDGDDPTETLQANLGRLPLNQRTAVSLSLLSGFSNAETGHIMGLSTDAVESLIARARRALREGFRHPDKGSPE